jgi:hypothetical protein
MHKWRLLFQYPKSKRATRESGDVSCFYGMGLSWVWVCGALSLRTLSLDGSWGRGASVGLSGKHRSPGLF